MNAVLLSSSSLGWGFWVFYIVIIVGMFWLMGRSGRKERKRLKQLLAALAVGDTVKTTSGFYGVVIDITDDMVIVEFGNNKNCRIPMDKGAITDVEKPEEIEEN